MRITKTSQAIEFFKSGDFAKAFKIFRTFKMGISKAEKRTFEIASECLAGKGGFYSGLNIDVDSEIEKAKQIVTSNFITP